MDGDVEQVRPRARRARRGRADCASTRTAPGRRGGGRAARPRWAPLELAEQPVATLEEMARAARQTEVPLAADESVATPDDARGPRGSACDCATVKLAKVGGPRRRAGDRRASCPCTCRARWTARSGSRPRRTSPGAAARRRRRARPRDLAAVRATIAWPAAPSWTGRCSRSPTGPGLGRRDRRARARRGTVDARVAFAGVDPANRNTALASALRRRAGARGRRARLRRARARARAPLALALWRAAGHRGLEPRRRALLGFLRARPRAADRPAGGGADDVRHRRAPTSTPPSPRPREARVPLIVITADRPPELRGRGAGQTIDQLKLYGAAVRWFCEVGVQQADDAGLLPRRARRRRAPWRSRCGAPARARAPECPAAGAARARRRSRATCRPRTRSRARAAPAAGRSRLVSRATAGARRGAGRRAWRELIDGLAARRDPRRAAARPGLARGGRGVRRRLRLPDAGRADVAAAGGHARPLAAWSPTTTRSSATCPSASRRSSWSGSATWSPRRRVRRGWPAPRLPAGRDRSRRRVERADLRRADLIARADPGLLLGAFAEQLEPRSGPLMARGLARGGRDAPTDEIDAFLAGLGDEPFEPRVHRDLARRCCPPRRRCTSRPACRCGTWRRSSRASTRPLRFLANRGANGIDGLVSSGLGAAAAPRERTFILTGDVGLYHDMNGLLAMRRLGVEATIVVLNNGGGGDLRVPADRAPPRRLGGAVRHADRARPGEGGGALRAAVRARRRHPAELEAGALGRRPGMVEVAPRPARRNVAAPPAGCFERVARRPSGAKERAKSQRCHSPGEFFRGRVG